MTAYSKTLEIHLDQPSFVHEKLSQYFSAYHFLEAKSDDNQPVFYKKGSLLDGWKFNPLNWQSKCTVEYKENSSLCLHYTVPSHNVIQPVVFHALYDGFLLNLEAYLVKNEAFEAKNKALVRSAKKSILRYYGIMFLGVMLAFLIGTLVQNLSGNQLYGQISSIGLALLAVKLLNNYLVRQTTKQA